MRRRVPHVAAGAAASVLAAGLLASGSGCRGERTRAPDSMAASATPAAGATPVTTLQLVVAPDSALGVALADSLTREGWAVTVGRRASGDGGWPVQVAVPGDTTLAHLVAHALGAERADSLDPEIVPGPAARTSLAVAVVPVNRGTHGMSARVRWTLSADRRALLVVEDPRGAEGDPVPNGFVLAAERAAPIQRDSVWDVAPSPDWTRVAYSRAYTTAPGEADSVPPSEWHRLTARVGLMESVVRRNAFPTSGMVVAFGVARPFVVDVSAGAGGTSRAIALPLVEGWRLGWTADGSRLAVGAPPERVSDDGVAARWRLVDPTTGAPRGVADAATLARPQWSEGPTLEISTQIEMKERRAFRAGDVDIESEDGWIRIYGRGAAGLRSPRIVGPGVALTATATGEFIAAIVPSLPARSYDPRNELVVYHIIRQ